MLMPEAMYNQWEPTQIPRLNRANGLRRSHRPAALAARAGMLGLVWLLLAGCATPYQPRIYRGDFGYWNKKLDDHTFAVSFYGNEFTRADAEYAFFLHRCAEVTIKNGDDYFVVQNLKDIELVRKYQRTGQTKGIIRTFKGAPPADPAAFDAQKILHANAPKNKQYQKATWNLHARYVD
jgi:hypothetical protein